jgi:hypothetical protein
MKFSSTALWAFAVIACTLQILHAQELAPRAYVITPLRSNAVTLTYAYNRGGLQLGGEIPVSNATGNYSVPVVSYFHTFGFFGRSANVAASLPYGVGTFQAEVNGSEQQVYRSGLTDSQFRLSVNLFGAPAMQVRDFVHWRQKTLLGISVTMVPPTGQYDPNRVVNWGSNRWSVKPEVGYSHRRGNWVFDVYAGAWLYSINPKSFSRPNAVPQSQEPVESFESHLSYDLKPRLWVSLDGNYWFGGLSSLDGVPNPATRQTSSRIGVTASLPLHKHQSVKISYSGSLYVRFGADYNTLSAAWQYSWIGWKK